METILELMAAREMCLIRIRADFASLYQRGEKSIEEWKSSGLEAKFYAEIKLEKQWTDRLQTINGKLFNLIEKAFPLETQNNKQQTSN